MMENEQPTAEVETAPEQQPEVETKPELPPGPSTADIPGDILGI
jgi:hypothetical protein